MKFDPVIDVPEGLQDAIRDIQQPRTDFQLKQFVLGQHCSLPMQYFQCVLELSIKLYNIRRALLQRDLLLMDIADLEEDQIDPRSQIQAKIKRIDLEEMDNTLLGAIREYQTLCKLWESFPRKYTREEMDADQEVYWHRRLVNDAQYDLVTSGRIGRGTIEVLDQLGMRIDALAALRNNTPQQTEMSAPELIVEGDGNATG